ncbi:MAG: hypothetical protein JWR42_2706 [Marmoricola sp.]|nr:hypothetical protein [Marmoricola sp.]
MTVVEGTSAGRPAPGEGSGAGVVDPEVPVRADGVQLIGEMKGSGYRTPPALARRGDGQTIQLTALLHLVLEAVDGRRTHAEIAERVSERFGRTVSADNVRTLVDQQLRTTGLVVKGDGSQPEVRRSNPLLALRFKYAVTDPERTRRLTAPFALLFNPVVVVAVLVALVVVSWWVFFREGLASATHDAFDRPGLLLLVVLVTVLSAGFHEFGHAAGARRGGATPGVMGAGIYLVWPAFFTDVTDSYRLGRWGRVVTDLGGLYFNAIVAVAIAGVWWLTSYDALLLVVATQILQMVRQLTPVVRFDGYHVLADVTGVPDLFHRIRPTLLSLLPWRWRSPEAQVLKPWARAVVSLWVIAVVPMLVFSLWCMVLALPRLLGTAWASAGRQAAMLGQAWGDGDVLGVGARAIAVLAVVFPVLATGVVLVRLLRQLGRKLWTSTEGRPARRGASLGLVLALVLGLTYLWWPRPGSYAPIMPFEGGTVTQAVAAARPAPGGALRAGSRGTITTGWPDRGARPTREKPQLAVILVPHDRGAASGATSNASGSSDASSGGAAGSGAATPGSWVFPFDRPLRPGKGDNQALAVNTRDGTIQYDVAFALVWIDDDSPALNKNEAYAFASCTSCGAVAVGFQVVLVTGENHVAAPQNLSGALNSDCVNCLTYALATQLFVTLDGPLKEPGMQALTALWAQIADFGAHITEVPLSEIQDRLTAYEKQILEIIAQDQGPLTSTSPGPGTPTATDDASGAPTPGATASTDPTSSASPGSTATGSSDGATPTASPTGGSTTSAPDGPATSAAAGTSGPTPTTDPSADPTSVSTP